MAEPARKLPVADTPKPAKWNHQKWATLIDPAHKSDISDMVGEYGCTEAFARKRRAEAAGERRETTTMKAAGGNAVHTVLARIMQSERAWQHVVQGGAFPAEQIRSKLRAEYEREVDGMDVIPTKSDPPLDKFLEERAVMIEGCLASLQHHVAEPILAEAGFIAPLGDYWTEGHVDLIFKSRQGGGLAFTDWKTGSQKPSQVVLEHGYESGFYSNALRHGAFVPEEVVRTIRRGIGGGGDFDSGAYGFTEIECLAISGAATQRDAMHVALRLVGKKMQDGEALPSCVVRFDRFPDEIWLTHLADFLPYQRKSTKTVTRPEDCRHYGVEPDTKVVCEKGDTRGPGWLPIRRTEQDIPRLEHLLRNVAGWIRFGRFVPAIGDKCNRCAFHHECLNAGHEVRGNEAKDLQASLRGLDLPDDGLGDEA